MRLGMQCRKGTSPQSWERHTIELQKAINEKSRGPIPSKKAKYRDERHGSGFYLTHNVWTLKRLAR